MFEPTQVAADEASMAGNLLAANVTLGTFEIHHDADPARQHPLPNGSCHFVDLTPGANGARCGCRRFWPLEGSAVDQASWCMCAHHACFHDDDAARGRQPSHHHAFTIGQENERPLSRRQALSPVTDALVRTAPGAQPMDLAAFSTGPSLSFVRELPEVAGGMPESNYTTQPPGSLPDTLAWADLIQPSAGNGQAEPKSLPKILPPPPVPVSQSASMTSSAHARYLRPFAGRGLNTLDAGAARASQSAAKNDGRQDVQFQETINNSIPSHGSLAFVRPGDDHQGAGRPQPRPEDGARKGLVTTAQCCQGLSQRAIRNLTDTISGHEQRLDCLETVSFSAHGHEDCLDKHEHMDLRVTELEQKMDGVEKAVEVSVSTHKQGDAEVNSGPPSIVSTVTSVNSRPNSDHIMSQLSSIQAQVNHLSSYLPSYGQAWRVEVVFLPFPLQRIWQRASQFKTDAAISCDDWSQRSKSLSGATSRSQSPFGDGWADDAPSGVEWLYPRACGDKSTQDKRLRSRGLIQTVSFRGPDAGSVHMAIHEAFGSTFRDMGLTGRERSSAPGLSRHLGLRSAWAPLRKIHKDSRLRFLNAAEMLTPALWDVNFLHSIVMKAVEPRLFITHPDAYIQDREAYGSGWDWQRIRNMKGGVKDAAQSQEADADDAAETENHCWTWNEQLDAPPSSPADLGTRIAGTRAWAPFAAVTSERLRRSISPFAVRASSPAIAGRRGAQQQQQRPPRIRTSSVASVPGPARPSLWPSPGSAGRRRIISHDQGRQPTPYSHTARQPGVQKRRRGTRSPSYHRHTPRWTASPSPMPPSAAEPHVSRGITPVAYATPYSNAPLQELRPLRGSSVARSTTDEAALEDMDYTDEVFRADIYESSSDESYHGSEGDDDDDDDDDNDNDDGDDGGAGGDSSTAGYERVMAAHHPHAAMDHDSQARQPPLPEDEAWPGIEDQIQASDGENVDPDRMVLPEDQQSNASSQPSEYPATERAAWNDDDGTDFRIHEDQD
ncbi:hypothetical protein AAL_00856 [Moelleriella libera RCEF 2490]|uniref:Uncharacterized protein n=1 Tax=Moelleriella libera RCEF 2490 TaxID=1081109 RepID=A0A166V8N8_9HYPO|nr:hypothetical protein AAL_00856 [Moelleriella libera RCEF 2490]